MLHGVTERKTEREGGGGDEEKGNMSMYTPQREGRQSRIVQDIASITRQSSNRQRRREEQRRTTNGDGGEKLGGSRWMILPPAQTEKTV